ncbi:MULTISPECIES: ferredoxin [unclassified Streptomyces]|nr:ferredoxin [Streptomyces sp. SID8499]NED35676.1 ferredoxin [Streptomyces sp. SID8499]NED72183.1 ferredoxin [Streptomyces sp. SID9944]
MRVHADRSRCMAAGHCAVTVPGVFDHGDDGLVVVTDEKPGEDYLEEIELAVDLCPSRALSVTRDQHDSSAPPK